MSSRSVVKKLIPLEKIITPSALVLVDDDIVKTYTNPGSDYNDESEIENAEAVIELLEQKQVFHLVVPDPTTLITLNPRDIRETTFESLKRAEAIVIKTLGHRLLANFYVKERVKNYPVRIFDNESDAISWFRELRLANS